MSATLEAAPVAHLLGDAGIVESPGRSFPVELRHLPRQAGERIEYAMASAIRLALRQEKGSILAFLPGRAEIGRTLEQLKGKVPENTDLLALHGGLEGADQDRAIQPASEGRRKIVLSTSLAESSITIDGVRIVIDGGLSRVPRYEPSTGITRLETVRVSRASADQRAGRAGRTGPGIAIRLWHEGQTASLVPMSLPSILTSDLTGLVLDCAAYGIDPAGLRLLDAPPPGALDEARSLLRSLEAMDDAGRLTQKGAIMLDLPLQPRLAAMVLEAGKRQAARLAAELALLISERGLGGDSVDLERRLARLRQDRSGRGREAAALARRLAARVQQGEDEGEVSAGRILAQGFPDRIAQARGAPGQFRLANGHGARLDEADPLAAQKWLVVADLTGTTAHARILAAAPILPEEIEDAVTGRVAQVAQTRFDPASSSLRRRGQRKLGALVLSDANLPPPSGAEADLGLVAAIRAHGLSLLPWSDGARHLLARMRWLRHLEGDPWPCVDEADLLSQLEKWLLPYLTGSHELAALSAGRLEAALQSLLPYELQRELDILAPPAFVAPTGNRIPIRYEGEIPVVAVRVQELYGLSCHPAISRGKVPLLLELLSPAGRPVQLTRDLPGFWQGSWREVRTEMRGRYPKHFWPETPATAVPTARRRPERNGT